MATKTSSRDHTDAAQETVDRIRELNERIVENARKAGDTYLDVYKRSLQMIVDYQTSVASAAPADWLKRTLETQAAFRREVGELYASTAEDALKKN